MKNFLIGCLTCVPFSTFAMEAIKDEKATSVLSGHQDLSEELVKEVAPGVYAGSTKVGNETVYFGAEKLDETNQKDWLLYRRYTAFYTDSDKGLLCLLIDEILNDNLSDFTTYQQFIGINNESERDEFINKIKKASNNKFFLENLRNISGGANHFVALPDGNGYVVYASRTPIIGKFPFPKNIAFPHGHNDPILKIMEYFEVYKNILAMVGSTNTVEANYYENRGIFRSPISLIEDGKKYPSLSLKLHGFSAASIRHIFKEKDCMLVWPAPSMQAIICKYQGWEFGDVLIDTEGTNLKKKDLKSFTTEEELQYLKRKVEHPYYIKIDALIRIFKE